jgi:peptidoglycan hydrolase-like protein with peptidoglycan-binding domain
MNPEQIKALQRQLKAQGFYDGPIDGIMGQKMQAAMAAVQVQGGQSEAAKLKAQEEASKAQAAAAEAEKIKGQAALLAEQNKSAESQDERTRRNAADEILKKYQGSTLGQTMGAARTLAPFLGVAGGYGDTLMARKFLGINDGSMVAGPAKRLAILGAFGVPAGVAYSLGRYAENQGNDPNNTHFQHDLDLAAANLGYGMMGGNLTGGVMTAGKDIMKPGAFGASNEPARPPVAPPPVPRNEYKGMSPTEASKKLLRDLGVASEDISHLRGKNVEAIPEAIKSAGDDTVRNVARGFPGVDANEPDPKALRDALKAASTKRLMVNRALGIGAPIAVGIGAAAWPRPTYASDGSGRIEHEPFSASASRALSAAKELPGEMIRGIPESLREMTPGMQSGALGVTPEQFEAQEAAKEAAKAAASEQRDARERAIMSQLQARFPEPRANDVPPAIKTLENAADEDARAATGQEFAKGGAVHPKIAAMTRGLSGIQRSLDADMKRQSARIDNLERAKAKNASNGVRRALSKAHAEREDTIHDIWAVHYLAQQMNEGRLAPKLGMTKQAILALARSRYDRATGLPHGRRHF